MALTSIGDARTPGRPIEVTFGADTGQPDANQELLLIGHAAPGGGTVAAYTPTTINNSGDAAAARTEATTKFGSSGCELALMVVAAINANAGGSTFPVIKCIPLASTDSGTFGASDAALSAALNVKAEFIVSPYDGVSGTLRDKLKTHVQTVSGAQRVANNQFGSFGVVFNRSTVDPASLPTPDTQFIVPVWLRDTGTSGDAPAYSIGEMAAAAAARMASNLIPFNPLDGVSLGGVAAPAKQSDWPSVGDSAESETALDRGWTPLYVKPNGEVAFVRTITSRISADGSGSPEVTSYYDVQDFQVLYYWRKTLYTRFSQPDFRRKASAATARLLKSELIRMAKAFEDQNMFQAVDLLAKKFQVQRATTDRHAFEFKTPVNVIPGLHRIKGNIEATTEFDAIVV